MTNLTNQEHYINNLMELCMKQKLHPSELQTLVKKALRKQNYKGEISSTGLLMETQRRLGQTYPGGWL